MNNFAGVLPKYFSSEWSFAQFHLPEDTQFITAFGSQNTVIIVGLDGRYCLSLYECVCVFMFTCLKVLELWSSKYSSMVYLDSWMALTPNDFK